MGDNPSSAKELVEKIEETAQGEDKLTLGEILHVAGTRSYGPLLLIPGAIAISPVGAIPGMSVLTGTLIILIAGQLVLGRHKPWVPAILLNIKVPAKRVRASVEKAEKPARKLDKLLGARLTILCVPPWSALPALACILLAATFYPLALVPFGVTAPSAAVILLALGLTLRDGAVVLVGVAGALGSAAFAVWWFLF